MSTTLFHIPPRIRNILWEPRIWKCRGCRQLDLRRFSNDPANQLLALSEDSAEVLQEKNKQLRGLISSVAWPRITSFQVAGNVYPLPWHPSQKPSGTEEPKQLTRQQLEYMSGFFDGDGCVSPHGRLSGCGLVVSQSFDAAKVLLLYQAAFGGCIRIANHGIGLKKPVLAWELRGRPARAAASTLAENSIVKRRQLEIASSWPEHEADRRGAAAELAFCKKVDSGMASCCSWGYFAGFFDAEGYVGVSKHQVYLNITQKHVTVLNCLQAFLLCEMGVGGNICHSRESFALRITASAYSKQILKQLLNSGLIRKTEQALLALEWSAEDVARIRRAMEDFVGQQRFGRRLDEAGLLRAAAISRAQKKAHRNMQKGRGDVVATIFKKVDDLKQEHALKNAQLENSKLYKYLCNLKSLRA